jgi:hypothetical protein
VAMMDGRSEDGSESGTGPISKILWEALRSNHATTARAAAAASSSSRSSSQVDVGATPYKALLHTVDRCTGISSSNSSSAAALVAAGRAWSPRRQSAAGHINATAAVANSAAAAGFEAPLDKAGLCRVQGALTRQQEQQRQQQQQQGFDSPRRQLDAHLGTLASFPLNLVDWQGFEP